MRIVIRQKLRGGPFDGRTKVAVVRDLSVFDSDFSIPCRFGVDRLPTVSAMYIPAADQDVITNGELACFFTDTSQRRVYSVRFTKNIWRLKNYGN